MSPTRHLAPRVRHFAAVLLLAVTLAASGCGGSTKTVSSTGPNGQVTTQTVPNVHFAKTKFLVHAGLALGAIHRYIYKPLRDGALRAGAPGRVAVLLKGAAAAIFAVHELKLAHDDALSSDLLRPVANKLDTLGHKLMGLVSGLRNGSVSPSAILSSAGAANALSAASAAAGAGIKGIATGLG